MCAITWTINLILKDEDEIKEEDEQWNDEP